MLKIGAFSKLSLLTVKALRFYEKEGLLKPAFIDEKTGYRFYETSQLTEAARIRAYRQVGLSIDEIRDVISGVDEKEVLSFKLEVLRKVKKDTELQISIIEYLMEEKKMKYQVTVKEIPEMIVYSSETVLDDYSQLMEWVPSLGKMCMELNPDMKCKEPPYEFCEYLDETYREEKFKVRHSEAVISFGKENDIISFCTLPRAMVLSIYHKGSYDSLGEAYAYLMEYAEKNGYEQDGSIRASYIDGIWNKEDVNDWLTEVQMPVK